MGENGLTRRGSPRDDYSLAHAFNNHLMRILALTDLLELKLVKHEMNDHDRQAKDLVQSTQKIRGAVFDAVDFGKRVMAAAEPAKAG